MRISTFAILALFIGLISVSSCKKTNSGSYHAVDIVSATINDTARTFNFGGSILSTTISEPRFLIFQGFESSTKSAELQLNLSYFDSLTIGNYVSQGNSTITDTIIINGSIEEVIRKSSDIFYIVYSNTDTALYSDAHSQINPFIIDLTSIDSSVYNGKKVISAQGTFQGNIYLNGDTTQNPVVITNGQFNISDTL